VLVKEVKVNCSGCTACLNICPQECIEMIADEEGFFYPQIDEKKCTNCNLCRKICPFEEKGYNIEKNLEIPKVYAIKHKNDEIRMASSSGGVFTSISDFVLKENGVIIGAAFDNNFKVCHQEAFDKKDRDRFRGSKYVQSDLGDIFVKVKKHLDDKMVLFSGTPCQVAGLKSFLKVEYDNLITCDMVCHGVPSPKVFKDYISFMENTLSDKTTDINFRDKITGWHKFSFTHTYENRKISKVFNRNPFCFMFSNHLIIRPSCHNCVFTNFTRPSDITIADYWGIGKFKPDFDDNKGVSLAILNTNKGELLFEKIRSDFDVQLSNLADCIQPNLKEPTKPSPKRSMFWNDYYNRGFEYVAKKYAGYGFINNIKRIIIILLIKIGVFPFVKSLLRR